jgi:hypothetical protein
LNTEIQDERGLVDSVTFRKMFFTYFKNEKYGHNIYEMLWPVIKEHWDHDSDQAIPENDPRANKQNEVVRIERLTSFIDLFNYYPVKLNKLRYKNDSNELTYVLNGG